MPNVAQPNLNGLGLSAEARKVFDGFFGPSSQALNGALVLGDSVQIAGPFSVTATSSSAWPTGATASSTVPLMDGTATVGTDAGFARGDHVHPTDTSRAPLASPALTGTPTAPTPASGDNSTKLATTAFVANAVAAGGSSLYATAHVSVQRSLADNTETTVWFDTADTDTASGFNTSTGVYTVKTAGTYLVCASVAIDGSGVGNQAYTGLRYLAVQLSGGATVGYRLAEVDLFAARATQLSGSIILPALAVNTTISVRAYQTRDTAPGALGYMADLSRVWIFRVGA